MINWDELKHIHVIRKLEGILAQWFHTDIFFVDERGQVRNYDAHDKTREFKNPLSTMLLAKDSGRAYFLKCLSDANERAYKSNEPHIVVDGPTGIGHVLVSRIAVDNDYLGSVVAFSYVEKPITAELKASAKLVAQEQGLETEHFDQYVSRVKPLTDGEKKYFYELVDLVAQEIVTFHTEISKREERINALNNQLGNRYSYDQMIGKSKPMQDLYAMLDKIKNSESTVLVQGENGTGKELIARAIHFNSPRKGAQFVTVNCSAFNENLLDSELFGHVKGSFTGAIKDKKGLFESADKGTLFLDEIGDMSPTMQVKLLRVLQDGTLTPVGGNELRNLIVPPLRDRKEDIPVLVDHFISRGCKEKNVALKQFAKRTMEKIFDYTWPGNIRELENECERLIVLSGDEVRIPAELLSQRIRDFGEHSKVQGVRVAGKLKDALEELERTMIKEGLRRTNWNKSRLAKELGISRAGLIMKVEKYGLDKRKLARAGETAA